MNEKEKAWKRLMTEPESFAYTKETLLKDSEGQLNDYVDFMITTHKGEQVLDDLVTFFDIDRKSPHFWKMLAKRMAEKFIPAMNDPDVELPETRGRPRKKSNDDLIFVASIAAYKESQRPKRVSTKEAAKQVKKKLGISYAHPDKAYGTVLDRLKSRGFRIEKAGSNRSPTAKAYLKGHHPKEYAKLFGK